ncbi:MAG TPA: hypothetical protein V6D30_10500, partial [Leptolyngbyaceae cyanobacterium]
MPTTCLARSHPLIMQFKRLSKSFKGISAVVLILSLAGCDALSGVFGSTTYSVKKVSDGDTLTVT